MDKPASKQPKRRMLFCEPCGFRRILQPGQKPTDLVEVKTSAVPGGVPQLDGSGKTVYKPPAYKAVRYKCPCCGRGITVRELLPALANGLKEAEERAEKERSETERQRRLEDGKPHVRHPEEFMG